MRDLKTLAAVAPLAVALIAAAPEPKKPIELQKYTGQWYEVARLHNQFEQDCANAQVNYTPDPDGGFKVIDTCVRTNNRAKIYHPSMKVTDPGTNAKFRLTFFPFVWKDYWVLDYAPDNSWVVLGEPTGKYLWLFSRSPNLKAHKDALVSDAKALGYDTGKLIYDKGA